MRRIWLLRWLWILPGRRILSGGRILRVLLRRRPILLLGLTILRGIRRIRGTGALLGGLRDIHRLRRGLLWRRGVSWSLRRVDGRGRRNPPLCDAIRAFGIRRRHFAAALRANPGKHKSLSFTLPLTGRRAAGPRTRTYAPRPVCRGDRSGIRLADT